jgi:hypothetical protein
MRKIKKLKRLPTLKKNAHTTLRAQDDPATPEYARPTRNRVIRRALYSEEQRIAEGTSANPKPYLQKVADIRHLVIIIILSDCN